MHVNNLVTCKYGSFPTTWTLESVCAYEFNVSKFISACKIHQYYSCLHPVHMQDLLEVVDKPGDNLVIPGPCPVNHLPPPLFHCAARPC